MSKGLSVIKPGGGKIGMPLDTAGHKTLPLQGNVPERYPHPSVRLCRCPVLPVSLHAFPVPKVGPLKTGFLAAIVRYRHRVSRIVVVSDLEILVLLVDFELPVRLHEPCLRLGYWLCFVCGGSSTAEQNRWSIRLPWGSRKAREGIREWPYEASLFRGRIVPWSLEGTPSAKIVSEFAWR